MKVFNSIEYSVCWQKCAEELASVLKNEGVTYLDIISAMYWTVLIFEDKIKERKGEKENETNS